MLIHILFIYESSVISLSGLVVIEKAHPAIILEPDIRELFLGHKSSAHPSCGYQVLCMWVKLYHNKAPVLILCDNMFAPN